MKLFLLLIAVYALIVNQSSKPAREAAEPVNPQPAPEPSMKATSPKIDHKDLVAPVFSYSTFQLITNSPGYTRLRN